MLLLLSPANLHLTSIRTISSLYSLCKHSNFSHYNCGRFLTAVACIGRFVNAIFLIRVEHGTRILIASVLMLISFLLLALSLNQNEKIEGFYYSIIACLFHGFS